MADDEIDTETLQAQIDMSLAFAQDLVSSWIKPLKKPGASSSKKPSKDADKELEELLRRPPRLGVGAPLPEATSLSGRDTARLKNKLTGKKRAREDDEVVYSSKAGKAEEDDDEEESRAGAIHKRVKVDPFAIGGKKKKGKEKVDILKPQPTEVKDVDMKDAGPVISQNGVKDTVVSKLGSAPDTIILQGGAPDHSGTHEEKSNKKKRKKKNKSAGPPGAASDLSSQVAGTSSGLQTTPVGQSTPSTTGTTAHTQSLSVSPTKSQISPPKSTPQHNPFILPSSLPVLNLTGPPPIIDNEDNQDANTSPKKKRKRKKKKKGNHGEATTNQTS
ncbi:hypothetical protein DENSPDRAFT_839968 [Dentipellis sp. KUC8613]|nr:hypothetical protein DENSPDRAFT_839968 [Dentipellis sp. KUC8613]